MKYASIGSVIVTGAAGFIGMHVAERLLERGERVLGIDNFNVYYDVALKEARVQRLLRYPGFQMERMDIEDYERLLDVCARAGATRIVHLAAQAGVRHSIDNPFAYERSNLAGHLSVLEAARRLPIQHLVYASSSSVYGDRSLRQSGFGETDSVDAPASLYAATKRSCELLSQSYASLYGIPQSGLRFFTVYGPWGRPDMAIYAFTDKIQNGAPIEVFGEGKMARDFTYIDDIVDGVLGVLDKPPVRHEHEIFNIGNNRPVELLDMIGMLEGALGRKAIRIMRPMQPGDVTTTCANIEKISALTGYSPKVKLDEGLENFVAWWRDYTRIQTLWL